jgi:hypothetical protein
MRDPTPADKSQTEQLATRRAGPRRRRSLAQRRTALVGATYLHTASGRPVIVVDHERRRPRDARDEAPDLRARRDPLTPRTRRSRRDGSELRAAAHMGPEVHNRPIAHPATLLANPWTSAPLGPERVDTARDHVLLRTGRRLHVVPLALASLLGGAEQPNGEHAALLHFCGDVHGAPADTSSVRREAPWGALAEPLVAAHAGHRMRCRNASRRASPPALSLRRRRPVAELGLVARAFEVGGAILHVPLRVGDGAVVDRGQAPAGSTRAPTPL